MIESIYEKIVEMFEKGRFCVLATIVNLTGSGPRGAGTKFLIMEDGSYVGTIGGGLLEAMVLEGAGKVFHSRSPKRLFFRLMGTDVAETDMLCGGDVEVFLEPVSPENLNHLYIFEKVLEVNRRGGSGILATAVNVERWESNLIPKMFLDSEGEKTGALSGLEELEDMLAEKMPQVLKDSKSTTLSCRDREGKDLEIFVEPVVSVPVLYIFGGGHVSSKIVPLAGLVGFKVVVIDDRPEFADPLKFPEAARVLETPFKGVFDRIPVDHSSYLVIVTRGHSHDKTVLEQALRTDAKYVGMIGSRRKRGIIYEKLLEEGFTRKDLDRVHSPIGLDIGAETPEEISVSIVAEMIQVRAGVKEN
ncbi:MAG: XdhC family aldehyde oxidoreductase maturation factor [Pseudomonadota bacterium]